MIQISKRIAALFLMAFMASAIVLHSAHAQSFADAFGGFRKNGNTPIAIDADTLDVLNEQGVATFTGNVKVVQNETVLQASKLKVLFEGESLSGPSAIKRLEAVGNLRIKTGARSARANSGVFNLRTNKVVLNGNVRVSDAGNVIEGCRLNVDLKTGNAKMESRKCPGSKKKSGRVQLVITPKKK